jgi:hypothetical protein
MLYTQSHRGRKIEHPVVFLVRSATNHAPNLKNDANPIFGEAGPSIIYSASDSELLLLLLDDMAEATTQGQQLFSIKPTD